MTRRSPRLAAVTFDLWETLITDPPGQDDRRTAQRLRDCAAVLARHGHRLEEATLARAHQAVGERCNAIRATYRDLAAQEQVALLLECLPEPLSPPLGPAALQELEAAYTHALLFHPPDPVPHAREVLGALRAADVRVGLISNTGRTPGVVLRQLLARLGLLDLIEVAIFSDEVGACKPGAAIFARALADLGAVPHQALHVGDQPVLDVQGGKSAGLVVAQFAHRGRILPPVDPWHPDVVITDLREVLPLVLG